LRDHENTPRGDNAQNTPGGSAGDCAPVHPDREDSRPVATVSGCIVPNGKADIDEEVETFRERIVERIEAHVRYGMRTWLARHPRRSLRLIDAMGVCPLFVEGPTDRELHDYTERDVRLRAAVKDLDDLMRWFAGVTDEARVSLGEIIEHGPKSGHCYFTIDGMLCNPDGTRSIFDDVDE